MDFNEQMEESCSGWKIEPPLKLLLRPSSEYDEVHRLGQLVLGLTYLAQEPEAILMWGDVVDQFHQGLDNPPLG